jgi:hypothetical protein
MCHQLTALNREAIVAGIDMWEVRRQPAIDQGIPMRWAGQQEAYVSAKHITIIHDACCFLQFRLGQWNVLVRPVEVICLKGLWRRDRGIELIGLKVGGIGIIQAVKEILQRIHRDRQRKSEGTEK